MPWRQIHLCWRAEQTAAELLTSRVVCDKFEAQNGIVGLTDSGNFKNPAVPNHENNTKNSWTVEKDCKIAEYNY